MIGKLIHKDKTYDIDVPPGQKTFYVPCPICHQSRKQVHQKEKEVGVDTKGTARCNHCGEGFKFVPENEYKSNTTPTAPREFSLGKAKLRDLDERVIKYFSEKRGISLETLQKNYVKEATKKIFVKDIGEYQSRLCIAFLSFKDTTLKSIKYRDPKKNFALEMGSELVFYGLNDIIDRDEIIIVEGEIDKLSYSEVGIQNVVSVPNGVTISKNELDTFERTGKLEITSAINMQYLDDEIDLITSKKCVYIGTDNDAAGLKLEMELIRRIGPEKCKIINYAQFVNPITSKPCKDGNDILVHFGPEKLKECYMSASEPPLNDVVKLHDVRSELDLQYAHGLEKGLTTGYPRLDPHFTWKLGYFIVVNGHMGMGKTSFVLNLLMLSAIQYEWKFGIYCPENYPVANVYRLLIEIYSGKTMDIKSREKINMVEYNSACKFIEKHFYLIDSTSSRTGYTPSDLRTIASQMIQRYGINGFLSDPWNSLSHQYKTLTLDTYLELELSAEVRFATKNNVLKIVNTHPPTPMRQKGVEYRHPTAFEIRGGNIWANKSYAMICVDIPANQDTEATKTEVYIQKVKDHKLIGIPTGDSNPIMFEYQRRSGRYYQEGGYNPYKMAMESVQEKILFDEI